MADIMYDLATLRTVLSESTAFRTFCGAATSALALPHILYYAADVSAMPCAVLAQGGGWVRECVTMDQEFFTTPVITMTIAKSVTKTDSDATVFAAIATSMDAIMADIESNATWRIMAWAPSDEGTPERTAASANVDIVLFTVVLTGNQRS